MWDLLKIISRIVNRFKTINIINDFRLQIDSFEFSLTDKLNLKEYKSLLEKELNVIEISKDNRWGWFDEDMSTFYLKMIDGTAKQINFSTESGKSNVYLVFKILYKKFRTGPNSFTSTSDLKSELNHLGTKDITDDLIKNAISYLRKKIKASRLDKYIQIPDGRKDGYKINITRE